MHCPSCGAETTIDQRFCRSCGMDLETVSKLVASHSSPEALKLEKALSKKSNQQRMYQSMKFGLSTFILGMALLFITKTLEFPSRLLKNRFGVRRQAQRDAALDWRALKT